MGWSLNLPARRFNRFVKVVNSLAGEIRPYLPRIPLHNIHYSIVPLIPDKLRRWWQLSRGSSNNINYYYKKNYVLIFLTAAL